MYTFAANPDKPIRCSYLRWIASCTVRAALDFTEETPDEGGAAAQIGSLTHKGVEAFHLTTGPQAKRFAAAMEAMRRFLPDYPLADFDEARLNLTPYCADPRNQAAEIIAIEREIRFQLTPHPIDATKQLIYVKGTLDQLRRENGKLLVCDLKTGQPSGYQMVHDYAYQMAGYVIGARQNGFPEAEPGYIIRTRAYRERSAILPSPAGVYWHLPFTAEKCEWLLDAVRLNVALIRMGLVNYGTGPHCTYCTHKGLEGCLAKSEQKLGISLA